MRNINVYNSTPEQLDRYIKYLKNWICCLSQQPAVIEYPQLTIDAGNHDCCEFIVFNDNPDNNSEAEFIYIHYSDTVTINKKPSTTNPLLSFLYLIKDDTDCNLEIIEYDINNVVLATTPWASGIATFLLTLNDDTTSILITEEGAP